jgi:hypothetical protein
MYIQHVLLGESNCTPSRIRLTRPLLSRGGKLPRLLIRHLPVEGHVRRQARVDSDAVDAWHRERVRELLQPRHVVVREAADVRIGRVRVLPGAAPVDSFYNRPILPLDGPTSIILGSLLRNPSGWFQRISLISSSASHHRRRWRGLVVVISIIHHQRLAFGNKADKVHATETSVPLTL